MLYVLSRLIFINCTLKGPALVDSTAFAASVPNLPIDEALHQWNTARATLAKAFQAYMDAFSHFESAHARHFESQERRIIRAGIHAAIDEEGLSLASYQDSIAATRARLLQLHDTSKPVSAISTISRLSTEVLVHIFTLSVESLRSYYVSIRSRDRSIDQVNAVASVCSYWRSVAISTSSLWSYIDFDRMDHAELVPLWLERARGLPLDIVSQSHLDFPPTTHPQIYCVRSMFLRLESENGEHWVSEWCNNGTPSTLTTLSLVPSGIGMSFPASDISANRGDLVDLFCSLNTLHLSNVSVNWGLIGCRNLVTLSLTRLAIRMEDIHEILSANPRLQHVHVTNLNIDESFMSTTTVPSIQLTQLRTLELFCRFSPEWAHILALIIPGSHRLTLLVGPYFYPEVNDMSRNAYVEFCRRSHIERLVCSSLESIEDIATVIPSLEALFFRSMFFSDALYEFLAPTSSSDGHSPVRRFSRLRTLRICECHVGDLNNLKRVCLAYNIRNIESNGVVQSTIEMAHTIEDLQSMIGPEINVTVVPGADMLGFTPFVFY